MKPVSKDNLSKEERKALNNVKERDDVIFTKADKGEATVIWDTKDYIEEAEQQLNNEKFYLKLNYCPEEEHSRLISNTLDEFANNNELSKDITDGLEPVNATTPRFYLLPKIHKEGNPGRPVVSSVNSPTSKVSKFVDHHLQPSAKGLKSYVKDTTDFITKIKDLGTVPPNSFPVSMDITSLYTNIPNDEGLEALRQSLDSSQNPSTSTKVIVTLMQPHSSLKQFIVFNGINFLQTQGVSMGTSSAPSFSTIFLGYFEEK